MKRRLAGVVGAVLALVALPAAAQETASRPAPEPRQGAVTLQDLPRVRIDEPDGAPRRPRREAKRARRPAEGDFTFLSSTPGSYRRVTRITERLSYVEQLEQRPRYVTFQGGLRVALGK